MRRMLVNRKLVHYFFVSFKLHTILQKMTASVHGSVQSQIDEMRADKLCIGDVK